MWLAIGIEKKFRVEKVKTTVVWCGSAKRP